MSSRLFLSIEIPRSIKERVLPPLKELREAGAVSVPPKNLHLTVKFLGEVRSDKLHKTMDILEKIEFTPFKISIEEIGAFPNKEYVRVVWAGVKSKGLEELSENINKSLKEIFNYEKLTPHLTLARVKNKIMLNSFFQKYSNKKFGSFKAKSFELMSSEFTKRGVEYSVIWSSSGHMVTNDKE
ncbi:MAG: RNA 2',3'-cyclic phosphodiesterase [Candidatus ainarchaeum sp.]|nr:RNA 2',3'-cyclic phosphodiesterase [Candidatus ainarchaeum sp.]